MAYRVLLTGQTAVWAGAVLSARLPVAMAPLSFVFHARDAPGGYALGAVLAAAYTIAEAVAAPLLGARLTHRPMRRDLVTGLAVSSVALLGLALMPFLPSGFVVALAVLAGGAAAAVPSGLRTLLTRMVGPKNLQASLSAESVLNQAVWACGPALVSLLALAVHPATPFIVAAAAATASATLTCLLPAARRPAPQDSGAQPRLGRTLASAWPIYLTSSAAMYLVATAELVLPALLEYRGIPVGWSGVLLTAFAATSIIGGVVYGLRRWPGGYRRQSLWLLVGTTLLIALLAWAPALPLLAACLVVAGFFQAALLTARNLSLHEYLPAAAHAPGYALMYAGSGAGYGLSGVTAGAILTTGEPTIAVVIGTAATLLLTVISALGEFRHHDRV